MKCKFVSLITDSTTKKELVVLQDEATQRLFAIEKSAYGDGGNCDIYSPYDRRMLSTTPETDTLLHIDAMHLRETFGGNMDPDLPRVEWLKAINNHATDLGYWEWVSQEKENEMLFSAASII